MTLTKLIIISWDEFPDSFHERFERDLFLVDIEDNGVVCTIDYEYTPYSPGRYWGDPGDCYPAEEADVEVENMVFSIHIQRAATGRHGERLYERPDLPGANGQPSLVPMPGPLLQKLSDKFCDTAHSFASDWVLMNRDAIKERLLVAGKKAYDEGFDELFSAAEAAADSQRDKKIEDMLVEGAVADWVASRYSGGDK